MATEYGARCPGTMLVNGAKFKLRHYAGMTGMTGSL